MRRLRGPLSFLVLAGILIIMFSTPVPGETSNILVYGEFHDVDQDGNRDFLLTVIKVVPSEEIDQLFAEACAIYLDDVCVGYTNGTGNLIIYNVSNEDHTIRAVYFEQGQTFTDELLLGVVSEEGGDDSYNRLVFIIGLAFFALILAFLVIWGVDRAVKRTGKKEKKKEWVKCRACGAKVKSKNLDVHMFKVHKKR